MSGLTQYEVALATDIFDKFSSAATMKQVMSLFRELCSIVKLKPSNIQEFYPSLKAALRSWKAHAIFKKLDVKYNSKVYNQGKVCTYTKLLIIGAGPCGLRSAIDAQLLGAKVVVIEKRDRMSRNNILHLWPFVIEDLKNIGAKKFHGKFCAGAIDHISIRQLQLILLKVALILGVEIHENITFERLIEPDPSQDRGWKALLLPVDHPVSKFEFDVLIGADGKRNTLPGFKRNEFRGKLAIAITANFINRHSKQEASVPEISGTSFIFNQAFFIGLREKSGIDLENIVYYKDDTHYFVMTAKKQSLLERKVLIEDFPETLKLLSQNNVNNAALKAYALDAAEYATDYYLKDLEFAVNHYGHPDVSVFDFTSMFAAENASKVLERGGFPLLTCLVGDSLLEPFWPTGSGCARGFLSSLDACWALRLWAAGTHPLHVLAERESIYRLLAQTTPSNLNSDIINYTVDPVTRYVALNKSMVGLHQVVHLFDTDRPVNFLDIPASESISHVNARKNQKPCTLVPVNTILDWVRSEVVPDPVQDLIYSFRDGTFLIRIIHNYRPELIDMEELDPFLAVENNQAALDVLQKLGVQPFVTAAEMAELDDFHLSSMIEYMSKVYYLFKGEIPYTFYKKQDSPELVDGNRGAAAESRESDSRKKVSSARKKRRSKRDSVESPDPHKNVLEPSLEREDKKKPGVLSPDFLLKWVRSEVAPQPVEDLLYSFRDGTILCKILCNYTPELVNTTEFSPSLAIENHELAIDAFEKLGVPPFLNPLGMTFLSDSHLHSMIEYLSKIYQLYKDVIEIKSAPVISHQESKPELETVKIHHKIEDHPKFLQERERNRSSSDNRHGHTQKRRNMTTKCASIADLKRLFEKKTMTKALSLDMGENTVKKIKPKKKFLELQSMVFAREKGLGLIALEKAPKPTNNLLRGRIDTLELLMKPDHKNVQNLQESEDKINAKVANKKPKDLMRAIGTINETDWQLKQLEKKIRDTKFGAPMLSDKVGVPKWDKLQFVDRRSKITDNVDKPDEKYHMIDSSLKQLDMKLKEGSALETGERGRNKVSALAGQFNKRKITDDDMTHSQFLEQQSDMEKFKESSTDGKSSLLGDDEISHLKHAPKAFHHHNKVEVCHSCGETVYLMEKISPEDGLILHKKCFKCLHCSSPLKISSYMFDRDGKYGYSVFCPSHFGIMDKLYAAMKSAQTHAAKTPKPVPGPSHTFPEISEPDRQMVPKGDTPERIEIISRSEAEDQQYEMDEDEWTDRNFGSVSIIDKEKSSSDDDENTSSDEFGSVDSENESDSYSDSESDSSTSSSSERSSYEYSTAGEEAAEGTWGSEGGALELRRREVALGAPHSPSPSDTEVATDSHSKHSGAANSATEVSTDSEFGPMDVTPTIEVPTMSFADHKKRNSKRQAAYSPDNKIKQKENLKQQMEGAKRFQVTRMLEPEKRTVEIKPILPSFKNPITVPRPGDYLLSRTQSTTGIATKRALELKKKYLLGPQVNTALQKSDSASELNSKFREFHSNISECQKLLNPATEISPSMQAFLDNSVRRNASGLLSPSNPVVPAISNLVQNSDSKHNNNLETVSNPSQSMPDLVQTSLNSNNIVSTDQSVRNNSGNEKRPTSPVFKILVPKIPWKHIKKNEEPSGTDVDSDSLSLGSSSEDESENHNTRNSISVPRVEIMKPCGEVMQLDSLMIVDGQYIGPQDSDEDYPLTAVPKELPDPIPTNPKQQTETKPVQEISSSDSGNDITAFFTDNEPLDWAVEGSTDTLRLKKSKRNPHYTLDDHFNEHICGKTVQVKHKVSSVLDRDHSDIDFMDTGSEESVIENEDSLTTNAAGVINTGFVEFVDVDVDQYNTAATRVKYPEAVNKHCAPLLNYDRSLDYIEQGAGILVSNCDNSNLPQPVIKLNETVVLETAPIQNQVEEDEPAKQVPLILTLPSEPESIIDEEYVQLKSISDISECKDSTRKLSNSPATSRKLEELTKEKDRQKDLVHQLVMDNISKRTDRRDRRSRSTNFKPPVQDAEILEDVITLVQDPTLSTVDSEDKRSTNLKNSMSLKLKPLALDGTQCFNGKYLNNETFSLPDIHQSVLEEHSKRPSRNVFTVRQRMLSEPDALELSNCNPPTGIVPGFRQLSLSDYSGKLVQHVESLRNSKESCQQASSFNNFCTSDPNFFTIDKKHKGRDDRRKSIIKTVSDFFSRRRDPTGTNNISPTHDKKPKFQTIHKLRIKSNDETFIDESDANIEIPPPIPPLPDDYCIAQSSYGHPEVSVLPSSSTPKRNELLLTKKRCKSLNSIHSKPCDNALHLTEGMQAMQSTHKEKRLPHTCLCQNKNEEPLTFQSSSLMISAREKALEKRHEELRLQLRDLLNEVTDTNHARENAIINEMMAIVMERQALTSSKKAPNE